MTPELYFPGTIIREASGYRFIDPENITVNDI
jgi:hypothetical protein